jgi:hypothetical protein
MYFYSLKYSYVFAELSCFRQVELWYSVYQGDNFACLRIAFTSFAEKSRKFVKRLPRTIRSPITNKLLADIVIAVCLQ